MTNSATPITLTIRYSVTDTDGNLLDDLDQPMKIVLGQGQIFPALEAALIERQAGDEFELTLAAQEAYGEYDPAAVQRVSMASLETLEDLSEGMVIFTGHGSEKQALTIRAIDAGEVVLDGNHPHAGKDLCFLVKVDAVD
ncbi:MAG: peptidylprolyl isomerase [Pseudomonadales bacterium]|nr:peptidylprolyl isomerase [Pseudomonadales bacterium]